MRSFLIVLGLPTLGLAFAISALTTYGPEVLIHLTNSTWQIGALIGAEGLFALTIPLVSGIVSDRLPGAATVRRLPFVLAGGPLVVAGLVLFAFSHWFALAVGAVLVFFLGYYLYYPPYRALYADLLPRSLYARGQASQAVLRGFGLGVALLAGGLLLSIWQPLPFLAAAVSVVATTCAIFPLVRLERHSPRRRRTPDRPASLRALLVDDRQLRAFAIANALWEFSFSGLKSFIILYVVFGLGHSTAVASAVIAMVAIAYIVGAPLAGELAHRFGIVPVLRIAALVYGSGLVLGVLPNTLTPMVIALPPVALAGAIVMTLPQALAFTVAPPGNAGAAAGIQDFSRGIGVLLGPIIVGLAVQAFHDQLGATNGYAAMWPVIGIPVLMSLHFLRALQPGARAEGAPATPSRGHDRARPA
jgi:MFS family permease